MTNVLRSGMRNASSWAMRAWLALRVQGTEFEGRIIDLRRPQRFKHLAMVGEFSPAAVVPVLVTDSTTIFDFGNLKDASLICSDVAKRDVTS